MSLNKRPQNAYIPDPSLILLGCQAWDALEPDQCPVCKTGVRRGDDSSYCARCDSMSPKREAQIMAASLKVRTQNEIAKAEQKARAQLQRLRKATPVLTESQRRRLWMGYSRSGIDSQNPEVVNRSKVGRDWLIAIGQEPDWSIDLDATGRPKPAVSCTS